MTFWGIGGHILIPTLACSVPAVWASKRWPELFAQHYLPEWLSLGLGLLLFLGGLILALGARRIRCAFHEHRLLTTGIYGWTRNPIYAAWLVCLLPGLVLVTQWWLMIVPCALAWILFYTRIGKEREYLLEQFGEEYLDYERRVNLLIPWPGRQAS